MWAAVQVAHAFFGGMAGTVWATLEAFAGFLGTSVQFVICESSQLAGGIVGECGSCWARLMGGQHGAWVAKMELFKWVATMTHDSVWHLPPSLPHFR